MCQTKVNVLTCEYIDFWPASVSQVFCLVKLLICESQCSHMWVHWFWPASVSQVFLSCCSIQPLELDRLFVGSFRRFVKARLRVYQDLESRRSKNGKYPRATVGAKNWEPTLEPHSTSEISPAMMLSTPATTGEPVRSTVTFENY